MLMKYSEIYDYWSKNLCNGGNPNFPFRFFKDEKVLEIGCGNGNDALRFVEAGAFYTGIDLINEAVISTKVRIGLRGYVFKMNAEFMDLPDDYFDLVYSFGVIHHTINPINVMNEAYRVLKPSGHLCIMLYNKFSLRYILDIMFLRKLLWLFHYPKYNEIRKKISHPTREQWVSINTDNLGCPLSKVYSLKETMKLLDKFKITKTWTENNGWFRILIGIKNDKGKTL